MATTDNGSYTIGSIAAVNNGVVASCYTTKTTKVMASYKNKNVLVGGLVGVNNEAGHVRFSFSEGEFTGYAVGGLVGANLNLVYECYSANKLIGKYVGGLAYNVSFGNSNKFGAISNCYTVSELWGVDKHSVKSGFAYSIDYSSEGDNKGKYGLIYHCFSGVDFNDKGDNYFETHSRVRNNSSYLVIGEYDREAGFIVDSIYDKQGREAKEIGTSFLIKFFNPSILEGPIGLDAEQCYNSQYFVEQEFDLEKWLFDGSSYPTLNNVVVAK